MVGLRMARTWGHGEGLRDPGSSWAGPRACAGKAKAQKPTAKAPDHCLLSPLLCPHTQLLSCPPLPLLCPAHGCPPAPPPPALRTDPVAPARRRLLACTALIPGRGASPLPEGSPLDMEDQSIWSQRCCEESLRKPGWQAACTQWVPTRVCRTHTPREPAHSTARQEPPAERPRGPYAASDSPSPSLARRQAGVWAAAPKQSAGSPRLGRGAGTGHTRCRVQSQHGAPRQRLTAIPRDCPQAFHPEQS